MAKMKMPEISVSAHYSDFSVDWKDATRRYHIWLDKDGTPRDDVLHSNPIVPDPAKARWVSEHRSLSQSAKKWAPLVSAIVAKIKAENLIAKAVQQAKDERAAEEAQRIADANAKDLARLDKALAVLPPSIGKAIRELSRLEQLALVHALNR